MICQNACRQCMDPSTALEILAKRNQRGGGENRIADARKELDLLNQVCVPWKVFHSVHTLSILLSFSSLSVTCTTRCSVLFIEG